MRSALFVSLSLAASLLAGAFPAAAQPTVVVPDDYPTIQSAIDAADDGWTILVRPGRYVENVDFRRAGGGPAKALTLRSTDGPAATIIDGSQPSDPERGSVVTLTSPLAAVLDGFTITGGTGTPPAPYYGRRGGGILVEWSGACEGPWAALRNLILSGNRADELGGGIYASYRIELSASIVTENSAVQGGGADLCCPLVDDCEFSGNAAAYSGAAFCYGYGHWRRCRFVGNSAEAGGALTIWESSIVIEDCDFIDNRAQFGGGAVEAYDEARPRFRRCRFIGNRAADGAAVYLPHLIPGWTEEARPEFESCLFNSNVATNHGGAIWLEFIVYYSQFHACTFTGNSAASGGSIWVESAPSSCEFVNCVFWNESPNVVAGETATIDIRHSIVPGGYPGAGNIDANPLFGDPAGGDFRLAPGSIAIDRGSNDEWPSWASSEDLAGNPRFSDGDRDGDARIDLGAFEFVPGPYDGRLGNVNTGRAALEREDVLFLNGSAGDAARVVRAAPGEPLILTVASPSSRPFPLTSRFAVYAWIADPGDFAVARQERGGRFAGWTAFPTPFSGGTPRPRRIWNNLGHVPLLGEPDLPSSPAPAELFRIGGGLSKPLTVTFQGFIRDDNAPNAKRVSVTNAVILAVE